MSISFNVVAKRRRGYSEVNIMSFFDNKNAHYKKKKRNMNMNMKHEYEKHLQKL